jgi:hypothetical protein
MALPFWKGKERFMRRCLFWATFSTYILLSLVAISARPGQRQGLRPRPTPTPAPTATPVAPTVEFQSLPGQDSVGRGENLAVYLFVSNKSNATLGKLKLNVSEPAFEIIKPPSFPATLPPFGSFRGEVILRARDNADFTPHKLLFTLEYAWDLGGGREAVSAQPATVAAQVKRRFEEEAKGFPGGTAAFLYLLLPIIPAILSYQFVESLRKEKAVKVPTFKAEYVVAAFFAAVVLNFLMLLAFNQDKGLNYSDPRVFLAVLGGSLVIGAVVPGIRLIVAASRMRRWGFDNTDTLPSYLSKALLSPGTPRKFHWVKGEADGEKWAGVLLRQPDGATVLGKRLQVSPVGTPGTDEYKDRWKRLTQNVLNAEGVLLDRRQLIQMIEAGELKLSALENVMHGEQGIEEPVVINEVKNFKQTDSEEKLLLEHAS